VYVCIAGYPEYSYLPFQQKKGKMMSEPATMPSAIWMEDHVTYVSYLSMRGYLHSWLHSCALAVLEVLVSVGCKDLALNSFNPLKKRSKP
jgi:hypothetical protein